MEVNIENSIASIRVFLSVMKAPPKSRETKYFKLQQVFGSPKQGAERS